MMHKRIKILLVGPTRSGKTAISNMLAEYQDNLLLSYRPTVGCRIHEFEKEIKAKQYPFSIKQKVEQGAFIGENNQIIINTNKQNQTIMTIQELALQGKHNLYNSMAAGVAGKLVEIRKDTIRESMSDFHNIDHRLELVGVIHGVEFINDSKATNVNSTWYALESMENPVILILGGVDKGNDYSMLNELVKEKVKAIKIGRAHV